MKMITLILIFVSIFTQIITQTASNTNTTQIIINKNITAESILNNNKTKCDPKICKLPLCKCSGIEIPGKIDLDDVPMMIMLTFNGVLEKRHAKHLKRILNPIYRNPNDCPVQATFFTSDKSHAETDYCLVQKLFNNNNEIGVGAPKYKCPYSDCASMGLYNVPWGEAGADGDIYQQKKNIGKKGRINRSFLRGFRVPFLDTKGSAHYSALKKYAFNYDSSVIIRPNDIKKLNGSRFWPHTLDYNVSYECENCPNEKFKCEMTKNCSLQSMWIVPMHYFNVGSKNTCPTLIGIESVEDRLATKNCLTSKQLTKNKLKQMLFDNFMEHYKSNKAPFVINIETSWFNLYGNMLTDALVEFINDLTDENNKKKDVYFVTVSKALDWIEYPTSLEVIGNKWLWDCDYMEYDYDKECDFVDQIIKNAEELEQIKQNRTRYLFDLRGEDLFRNGVLSMVIISFFASIIFVILYDKFYN